jgi:hypothetical protein
MIGDLEELERALEYPWDKWTVFLHPAQRQWVERNFAGPARVSGSAGTGKTIVALHRAVHLARRHPKARVLLTTFSNPLAKALGARLASLVGGEPAVAALSRVRLDGPFTNRALLGLGWAETDVQRPERALVPWLELREGRLLDSAVQESVLAVPYAYAQLASNGQAAQQYRLAVQAYAEESTRIGESIAAIREGGFLDAILDAAPQDETVGWFWQLQNVPDAPHTRYLYHLLASHEFQEGLKNYRDLRIMQRNLERSRESLAAFDHMVEAREMAAAYRTAAAHMTDMQKDAP